MASSRPEAFGQPGPPAPVIPGAGQTEPLRWAGVGDAAVLLHRVFPARALASLAAAFGRLQYATRRREAAVVRANLAPWAGNGHPAGALARRFFEERQVRRLLLSLSPRLSVDQLQSLFTVRGLDHLDGLARGGRGGILLLSHLHSLGGFVAVTLMRKLGYDVRVALPTMRDPWSATRLRRLLWAVFGREETVPQLIGGFPVQFNIRPIMGALAEGAIVAQTGDGWHSASFVDVPFLGRTIPFPTGVISVARSAGVPFVPVFASGPATRMEFVLDPPVPVDRGPGGLERAVTAYAGRLEEFVRAQPETWEHWLVPNTLDVLATWRERSLREKYHV